MAQMLASVSALLISVALLILGHGLQSTLLPLAASNADFSDLQIGAISSAYFIGLVLGCLGAPLVIMRAGHIRAYAAVVSLMSAAAILHPIAVDPVAWFAIRIISGFCLAGFYMIVESWLNESATNENRGTIMSTYVVILFAAMMVGQVSISGMDITSFIPFAIASVTVSLAVIPVALTSANQPAPITLVRFRPIKLYRNSPAALVGALLIGVANGAIWSLSPLYGSQIGFSTNESAVYAAAVIAGGMLSQWPVGRLSDRMDRRLVLLMLGVATSVVATGVAVLAPQDFQTATALAMLIGICSQPGYAIAVSHAFDYADSEDFVETSSGLLLAFGLGSVAGPISASILMNQTGPSGLYFLVAVVNVVMVAFILTRLFARSAIDPEEKFDFEYAATAQVGTVMSPEPLDVDAPNVIPPEEFPAYDDEIYNAETDTITEEVVAYEDLEEAAAEEEPGKTDDAATSDKG
ncbi:MFS transporter [Roseibium polysiphoniae]|uniref:MFS transporter n=1 Tax=Roseibium polysiphoniae TaxID=2571221 RepID=A0ABR9CG58_9HYPH|nr:MFS transporter [Roseibium polysiphoniae]MBD8877882.1 MFS transporter [Roseibium polysiphoniae]